MSVAAGLDWVWLKYMGKTILGLSLVEFWDSSLREINSLMEVHIEVNDPKSKEKRKQKEVKLTPFESVF
jgi:hypothetical protein